MDVKLDELEAKIETKIETTLKSISAGLECVGQRNDKIIEDLEKVRKKWPRWRSLQMERR